MPKSIQTILLHAEEISSSSEIDEAITRVDTRISELRDQLRQCKESSNSAKTSNRNIIQRIVDEMNTIYVQLDPDGRQVFDDLFSKRNQIYSGSEEQEFYFSKIAALNSVLKHDYPIIIDSFRSGELSSGKEEYMINFLSKLDKQVIVTSTLKNEEYSANRYSAFPKVNAIDYSSHQNSHILSNTFNEKFAHILNEFRIATSANKA